MAGSERDHMTAPNKTDQPKIPMAVTLFIAELIAVAVLAIYYFALLPRLMVRFDQMGMEVFGGIKLLAQPYILPGCIVFGLVVIAKDFRVRGKMPVLNGLFMLVYVVVSALLLIWITGMWLPPIHPLAPRL